MHKLIASSKVSNDFSIGFDESNARRKLEVTDKKEVPNKSRIHAIIQLSDVFGYGQHQEKGSQGLG